MAELSYRPATSEIPTEPGVYRYYDANDRVLYVGKASNLRNRISSYFNGYNRLLQRTRLMLQSSVRVDWTVVRTEIEALQLEYTWIKAYAPKYNIQLRDDKSYPYLAITYAEEAPRVIITRNSRIRGAKYFGPFPKVLELRQNLSQLLKIVPVRTCKDSDYRRAMLTGKPCFASQINKCFGPCSQTVTVENYRSRLKELDQLLSGRSAETAKELQQKMVEAAASQEYESAARYRDRLQALEQFKESSTVILDSNVDADFIGVAHDELSAAAQYYRVRNGMIVSARNWTANIELDTELSTITDRLFFEIYGDNKPEVKEILLSEAVANTAGLESWISDQHSVRVQIRVPQRGDKLRLAENIQKNAQLELQRFKLKRASDYESRTQALIDIQEKLFLETPPFRIECFDISHLSGTGIVGSMVVFEDGLPKVKQYRSFNVAEARDDTEAMSQVLRRRLTRLNDDSLNQESASQKYFSYKPNLLLIDGGLPQVNAVRKVLAEFDFENIAVVGIAKRLEELWPSGSDFPIILSRNSESLYLLQRIRDEAHRFAITQQRRKRKSQLQTQIEEIPGIGAQKAKALLRHFGSLAKLKQASVAEIAEVPGIAERLAEQIKKSFTD